MHLPAKALSEETFSDFRESKNLLLSGVKLEAAGKKRKLHFAREIEVGYQTFINSVERLRIRFY